MTPKVLRIAVVLTMLGACAVPSHAQSIYVAGSVGADILLVSGQESAGLPLPNGGGEALSGAARLGVLFEDRFGVELEVGRAGEIRRSSQPGGPLPLEGAFSIVVPEMTFSTQVTTVSTTASIRQQVADSVALVYLGGVVFHRTDSRVEFGGFPILPFPVLSVQGSFAPPSGLTVPPSRLTIPSYRVDGVQYGAGPVVGFETHIGVGEHLRVIPGVRLHGLPQAWLVRPSVAAGWAF
jgi:hypothetical protein